MPQLIRHQLGATLLEELRQAGLGVRDLFEGRQEPLSWYFRGVAYDQSELDILESGAVTTLHAPSALVELVIDEMALACANLGPEGVATYLDLRSVVGDEPGDAGPGVPGQEVLGEEPGGPPDDEAGGGARVPEGFALAPDLLLGYLNVDVAPPALWLEERESDPESDERLANRLAGIAQQVGSEADSVEVHIEGALDAAEDVAWVDGPLAIRPAGVSLYYSFDLPLASSTERELAVIFGRGAETAAGTLERMRAVFREE